MALLPEPERSRIYTRIKHQLGAPLRSVELEDEMMDSLMELAIGDYEEYILQWLIDSQWVNLVNLNMNERSVARALVTRTMDFEQQFSYSYSKIVGLQTEGPWVLKKDYFILEKNVQTYEIPAGREVNELLWFTRSEMTDTVVDPFAAGFGGLGGGGFGGFGGMAQMGSSGGSYFMIPAFDLLLRMQDRSLKNRLIGDTETFQTKNGSEFNSAKYGGWYFTVNGSDSQLEFVQQHYLLDGDMTNGVGKVHTSIENMIMLQNFCKLHNIKFIHQFFMDSSYLDIEKHKEHQLINYLYNQLDTNIMLKNGMFEYLHTLLNIPREESINVTHADRKQLDEQYGYFSKDGFHPSTYGAELWTKNVLIPFLETKKYI